MSAMYRTAMVGFLLAVAGCASEVPDRELDAGSDGGSTARDGGLTMGDATPPLDAPPPNPRPPGTPDYLIISVSGHCHPITCGPDPNVEYLGRDLTIAELARPLLDAGGTVEMQYFTDNFYEEPAAAPPSLGFLNLLIALASARDSLVADWDNPTRIIVVAHSHGTVWAHTALHYYEQRGFPVPVDILVDFDAVSVGWESKGLPFTGFGDAWSNVITEYTTRTGAVWPFDVGNATDSWTLPGVATPQDIEDVVPDSVRNNFEVWSRDPPDFPAEVCDREANHRLDGSAWPESSGLSFFFSGENHNGTVRPGSDSVVWATTLLRAVYGL